MIKIIDYGMGNLRSVQKALEKLGFEASLCGTADELHGAEKLILPGVGAFRDAIAALKDHGLVDPIREHIAADRPFLGICLGLQLLFDVSYEDGEYAGLGIVPGEVVRFEDQPGLKIPHMGWNQLQPSGSPRLLEGIPAESHFYFVHSFHVVPRDESVIAARCEHGTTFTAAIERGNLFATQFHPEKSQNVGLKLLQNFAELS
ncbi:imidazole glycerol phosphate synthase subunit HisH [Thalassoroseus pseudoceratinae]|uniref:imidazole glycerol phosphate synthase subunit HisH n=1 Tax=Thalassoroseus pseudoceratinae TaxID=2713176 RepID=UPI0014246943|nr:imidazole glycerol phosphate synthase subunit HisH [Thalassoroseus pseudoceratinae]